MVIEKVAIVCLLSIVSASHNCIVPDKIAFGTIVVDDPNYEVNHLPPNATVTIHCDNGFKAYPHDKVACKDFNTIKPQCIKTCPPVIATSTAMPTCKFMNKNISCEQPYEDSVAIFECNEYYENRANDVRVFTCRFGRWNAPPEHDCKPVCGLRNAQAQPLIIGGELSKPNEFPWHVAIFKSTRNICGGVVITPRIVLSAAHCFESDFDPKVFLVAGGKTYNDFSHPSDEHVQYRKLINISIPTEYSTGVDSLRQNDIAVLLLEFPFKMNQYIQPACFDQNLNFNNDRLVSLNPGVVTGWGYTTETGTPSEHLKVLEVDYKTKENCTLRFDFKKYYFPNVHDKICAGHFKKGLGACKGDSGGGLTFQAQDDRYYVRGIVSISPTYRGGCDSSQYTLYTSIAYHLDFIQREIAKFEHVTVDRKLTVENTTIYDGGCIVPLLKDGEYQLRFGLNRHLKSGQMIPSSTYIQPYCNEGYILNPTHIIDPVMHCVEGQYLLRHTDKKYPIANECKKLCKKFYQYPLDLSCFYQENPIECNNLFDGVTVQMSCRKHWIKRTISSDPYRYCVDGAWNDEVPWCTARCGLDFDDNEVPHINPFGGQRDRFPWHVSIIDSYTNKYVCAGSLITFDSVVTSNCILNERTTSYKVIYSNQVTDDILAEPGDYDVNRKGSVTRITQLIPTQNNTVFAFSINGIEITHFLQPACTYDEIFRRSPDHMYEQAGYFINTEMANGTVLSFNKVPFRFKELKKCNKQCTNPDYKCNFHCVEILGNPTCTHIKGSGAIYPNPNDGMHYIVGIVDDKTNCAAKYTTLRKAGNIEWLFPQRC